jgi:hypothetical protein
MHIGAVYVSLADTTEHENVVPRRDREGVVEAVCRVHPSLLVGARISVIFTVDKRQRNDICSFNP